MTPTLTVGSLFAGIGGFDLGLERAGMQVKWQCEKDPWARKVLAKHWPGVPCYEDITTLEPHAVEYVDVLAGGFPCQDISNLNTKGTGLNGEKSGLWKEFKRIIQGAKPTWVIIENSASIRSKGLWFVLQDLDEIGFDAEWHCIPAASLGAPHVRDRAWIVAYTHGKRLQACLSEGNFRASYAKRETVEFKGPSYGDFPAWNTTEPNVGRVAHGVPHRVDRLRGLGNAVVPQVVEWLGRMIIQASRGVQ